MTEINQVIEVVEGIAYLFDFPRFRSHLETGYYSGDPDMGRLYIPSGTGSELQEVNVVCTKIDPPGEDDYMLLHYAIRPRGTSESIYTFSIRVDGRV